jgi:hypothetical protein
MRWLERLRILAVGDSVGGLDRRLFLGAIFCDLDRILPNSGNSVHNCSLLFPFLKIVSKKRLGLIQICERIQK